MDSRKPIYNSVLVIDDHKMITNGIQLLIGPMFEKLHVAYDGASGMSKALQHFPQLVIVDFLLPDISGDLLVSQLKCKLPATKILGYSFTCSPDVIKKMMRSGIHGYVIKTNNDDEFVNAIHLLMEGREYFCKEARLLTLKRYTKATDDYRNSFLFADLKFSGKELELVRLLCKQGTTKDICSHLQLSAPTVKKYRKSLYHRIGITNLAGLLKFALQNGIIQLEEL